MNKESETILSYVSQRRESEYGLTMIRLLCILCFVVLVGLHSFACSTECSLDKDCPKGYHCTKAGLCNSNCSSSTPCAKGYSCSSRGKCLEDDDPPQKECAQSSECEKGYDCVNSACVKSQTQGCNSGETKACFSGDPSVVGKGVCGQGLATCTGGKWSACIGDIKPTTEVCDGKDNDCDGQTDEGLQGCGCKLDQECPPSKPACRAGVCVLLCTNHDVCEKTERCKQGHCQTCPDGSMRGGTEVCDGKDNNCNGETDEGLASKSCYTGATGTQGKAACKAGTISCTNGAWTQCVGEVLPEKEVCDGKDNNCDGQIDEGFQVGTTCTSGVGVCAQQGKFVCKKNIAECSAKALSPSAETCDGKDNDCDGKVDNGVTCNKKPYPGPYGNAVGNIAPDVSFQDCDGKQYWLSRDYGSTTVKLLLVTFMHGWSAPDKRLAAQLSGLESKYTSKGLRILATLIEDTKPGSKSVSQTYCKQWASTYGITQSQYKDPGKTNVRPLYSTNVTPLVFLITTKDMKIVYYKAGTPLQQSLENVVKSLLP